MCDFFFSAIFVLRRNYLFSIESHEYIYSLAITRFHIDPVRCIYDAKRKGKKKKKRRPIYIIHVHRFHNCSSEISLNYATEKVEWMIAWLNEFFCVHRLHRRMYWIVALSSCLRSLMASKWTFLSHSMSFLYVCLCWRPYLFIMCRTELFTSTSLVFSHYSHFLYCVTFFCVTFFCCPFAGFQAANLFDAFILGWFDKKHWSGKMKYFLYSFIFFFLFFFFHLRRQLDKLIRNQQIRNHRKPKLKKGTKSKSATGVDEIPWNFEVEQSA